ncbi:hypothetical protein [Pseudobutyrivibrio ruminis]|uniref:hypothetical protein n=1 Tax=Pseudobutyrivibrio ruminis TaxID=46206 RepID=UPI0012FDCB5D|nr:hypothetical protein [Pseudobutyrivibrio ruminis]
MNDNNTKMTKDKFDMEYERFCNDCADLVEKKIVIYGTGRMTATLVEKNDKFHIVGLCDRDAEKIGSELYGMRVLSQAEAEKMADVIVINTSPSYWNTIYSRIKDWNIPIYFKNGKRAIIEERDIASNSYWEIKENKLINEIRKYDVISFDIFDTLICRQYCNDIDLFRLIEKKTRCNDIDFVSMRKSGAARAEVNANLTEIYQIISSELEGLGLNTQEIMNLEWAMDYSMMVPRKKLVEICKRVIHEKQVIITSDMYYSKQQISAILRNVGIDIADNNLYISCEAKASKEDGSIWKIVKKDYPESRILHIGDNEESDVKKPQKYGISTFWVMSPWKMFEESSIGELSKDILSLHSSLQMGLINSKIFNDPFNLAESKGYLSCLSVQDIGFCLLGDMAYTFSDWLIEKCQQENICELGFFSREAFFLIKQFEHLRKLKNCIVVKAKEIKISRRAIMNAAIFSREDIEDALSFPYKGTVGELLYDRFNIQSKDFDGRPAEILKKDAYELNTFIDKYEDEILQEAQRQRNNYLSYLKKIELANDITVVDSFIYGSTQYYLSKVMNNNLSGLYMLINKCEDNRCIQGKKIDSCFQEANDIAGVNNEIYENALFLEAFYTAPNGMVREIDDNGLPIYERIGNNQRFFDVRLSLEEGIEAYFDDFYKVINGLEIERDISFTKKAFNAFMKSGVLQKEVIKRSFFYDNGVLGRDENRIVE